MTALWIFLGIVVLNAALLACPVKVRVRFEDAFSAEIAFLFFRYRIPAQTEEKKEEKPAGEQEERKKRKITDIINTVKKKGLSGFLELLGELARLASGTARRVFSHVRVDAFDLDIVVGGSDAARAAINFGAVCAAVYPAAGALEKCMKFRARSMNIVPNYDGGESRVRFRARARVRLFFLVSSLLWALSHSGGLVKALKEQSES